MSGLSRSRSLLLDTDALSYGVLYHAGDGLSSEGNLAQYGLGEQLSPYRGPAILPDDAWSREFEFLGSGSPHRIPDDKHAPTKKVWSGMRLGSRVALGVFDTWKGEGTCSPLVPLPFPPNTWRLPSILSPSAAPTRLPNLYLVGCSSVPQASPTNLPEKPNTIFHHPFSSQLYPPGPGVGQRFPPDFNVELASLFRESPVFNIPTEGGGRAPLILQPKKKGRALPLSRVGVQLHQPPSPSATIAPRPPRRAAAGRATFAIASVVAAAPTRDQKKGGRTLKRHRASDSDSSSTSDDDEEEDGSGGGGGGSVAPLASGCDVVEACRKVTARVVGALFGENVKKGFTDYLIATTGIGMYKGAKKVKKLGAAAAAAAAAAVGQGGAKRRAKLESHDAPVFFNRLPKLGVGLFFVPYIELSSTNKGLALSCRDVMDLVPGTKTNEWTGFACRNTHQGYQVNEELLLQWGTSSERVREAIAKYKADPEEFIKRAEAVVARELERAATAGGGSSGSTAGAGPETPSLVVAAKPKPNAKPKGNANAKGKGFSAVPELESPSPAGSCTRRGSGVRSLLLAVATPASASAPAPSAPSAPSAEGSNSEFTEAELLSFLPNWLPYVGGPELGGGGGVEEEEEEEEVLMDLEPGSAESEPEFSEEEMLGFRQFLD